MCAMFGAIVGALFIWEIPGENKDIVVYMAGQVSGLQGQLATRDLQLAEEQQKRAQVRTVKVIEKEVIYRDRIKNPDTAKCVADSGLFDLINAAYGLSGDTE